LIHLAKNKVASLNFILPLSFLLTSDIRANAPQWKIFWIFLKVGSILYGSGYILFAFLNTELVKTGILSHQVLIDAIAVGQFTPGPVFSSATFIGWQMGGMSGAIAATVGIFLPSFLFVAFLNPLVRKLRGSKAMSAFLDTVNVASIALILAVCVEMGRSSITNWKTILIAILGLFASLFFRKLNSAFVVLGGSLLGYLLWLI
ncbi:MAG TPA: chromate transporter, partial [Mucilaginibacter sp.]|nr:chromate transporter [Mucilaginibacter sp.]